MISNIALNLASFGRWTLLRFRLIGTTPFNPAHLMPSGVEGFISFAGRPKPIALVVLALGMWLGYSTYGAAAGSARDQILETFGKYEALHKDFTHGRGDKSQDVARQELETYGEGPFETALNLAKTQVCNFKDAEVVKALFRVKLATRGSANEAPAWTLGDMFFCQSELVAGIFKALPIAQQKALYSDFLFGFENVVYDKPRNNKRVLEIRRRLEALEPK